MEQFNKFIQNMQDEVILLEDMIKHTYENGKDDEKGKIFRQNAKFLITSYKRLLK